RQDEEKTFVAHDSFSLLGQLESLTIRFALSSANHLAEYAAYCLLPPAVFPSLFALRPYQA
ncbi:MAG TPA: hypothetical protein VN920_07725, partial [Pyrinomonadaceae bacterium]|nr:hypothetical protein [Pyrinomonadaceae bacterium]